MTEFDCEDLDTKLLAQMFHDFIEESHENLDQLNLNLAKLEDSPDDEELINETFRVIHTLKGTASFVGLDHIKGLSHKMEDVFDGIRKGELAVTASLIDTMYEGLEVLTLLRDKAAAKDTIEVDISWIVQKLENVLQPEPVASPDQGVESKPEEAPTEKDSVKRLKCESVASQPAPPAGPRTSRAETIRVSTQRLDNLMNMVGEVITARNQLNDFSERTRNDELASIAASIDRLTRQIHNGIMGVRMVPIEKLFNKFPGVVRNLARENGKQVEFVLSGEDTELDKTMIEHIYDPMVHLLRNAVDHGLEHPEIRLERGKSPTGKIRLSALQQQNNVTILVEDDGQGIDPAKMKEKAVRKGIISKEEAQAMTEEQAIRLIFMPGFSSVEAVTEVSGRGIGLDVVKEQVQKLRGVVDVRSVLGQGTVFHLQMPLTLTILQTLLVESGGLTYGLPLNTVCETLLITEKQINTIEKDEVVFIRGVAYPLVRLASILNEGLEAMPIEGYVPVVVVGMAEKRVALCVDDLLGKQEVVMKTLGDYLGRVEGIEGASIMADGSVALILDVEAALGKIG
ncbi:MAG: chemotaxis protein CheA [Deltaproteobacteria bacterium]|nr:chemotaxis protein CheA [Deltaproteobacteria bacterium]